MARNKKSSSSGDNISKNKINRENSSSSTSVANEVIKPKTILSKWKIAICFVTLTIAVGFGFLGYLETRINTPFDKNKMVVKSGLDVPDMFWGSYRPGVYFGLKTRDPKSLVTGLLWYFPRSLKPDGSNIRHTCEQGDQLKKYSWLQHDGSYFGYQEIEDGPFLLKTSFIKKPDQSTGGDWTARIEAVTKHENLNNEEVSFIWYTALDDNSSSFIKPNEDDDIIGIRGSTASIGYFETKIKKQKGNLKHVSYVSTVCPGLHLIKNVILSSLRLKRSHEKEPPQIVLGGKLLPKNIDSKTEPNLVAVQISGIVPFSVDITFESGFVKQNAFSGEEYTTALQWHKTRFNKQFDDTFKLTEKGFNETEVAFAQAVFSNLIGGIGYFYGASRVQSKYTNEPVPYWKAPLFTAVPSRSFFPRGFLWDEGFHGLLLSTWDLDLELDIICHWFDLMNVEGWIPREQILGSEALSKVPEEFVTQRNTNANPPTFFLTLQFMLQKYKKELEDSSRLAILERLYPRLQAWFQWFNSTQRGSEPSSYRWRGRDAHSIRELNPKTLTSGLDDYPRASHPTDLERHLDLRCWLALAANILAQLADLLGRPASRYAQTAALLSDSERLNRLHWSEAEGQYADWGLHTDAVTLRKPPPPLPGEPPVEQEMFRVVLAEPKYRYVDSSFGYVSLFPLFLQLLPANSMQLGRVLSSLRDPKLLWTDYGLRSLAKSSPLYMKRNTEHDPPYWRGQIWINMNYLAVRALYHYASIEGPHRVTAKGLYTDLRQNLVQNMLKQYLRSGYVWENYNDVTGEGQGCHPFTGWSSLVVMLMAEIY